MVPPSDPKPAPTDIAPVGFSITSISIVFVLSIANILSSQNEQDIQTLSIFSEYVKSKNYDAAYTPWMELRQRNPRFNKAIFIYGERILKNKIKTSDGQEKINFINDMLKLWDERKNYFPSSTPVGTYSAKACQLKYDYKSELGYSKEDLLECFSLSYQTDSNTFTNPKSLYTYFSLVVDMFDLKEISAQELFRLYDVITEKVENEVKNYTTKRNSFLNDDGSPKELSRKDSSKLNSYNSYLSAFDKIAASIDTKLGSRANCENLIPLYQRDFESNKTNPPVVALSYNFLNTIRRLTITSFKWSETIGEKVLAYNPIPGRQVGCVDLNEATGGRAWSP